MLLMTLGVCHAYESNLGNWARGRFTTYLGWYYRNREVLFLVVGREHFLEHELLGTEGHARWKSSCRQMFDGRIRLFFPFPSSANRYLFAIGCSEKLLTNEQRRQGT